MMLLRALKDDVPLSGVSRSSRSRREKERKSFDVFMLIVFNVSHNKSQAKNSEFELSSLKTFVTTLSLSVSTSCAQRVAYFGFLLFY